MSNQVPFKSWLDLCVTPDGKSNSNGGSQPSHAHGSSDEVAMRLRKEARLHFEALSSSYSEVAAGVDLPSSPSKTSSVSQDISKASSTTPNGALAHLVSSLGPAFSPSANIDAKERALHCLMGSLEGCNNLTHGVRQAVGRFLVELCRPESGDNASDGEDNGDDVMDQPMDYVDAGNLTSEQVTQQLESMVQQKRSADKRSSKVTSTLAHDDARDAALVGLTASLHSHLELFPTQQSLDISQSPLTEAMGVVYQSMELRLELAMLGLRYRCQTEKSDPSNGDEMWGGAGAGYETTNPALNIEDGLSQLPRLKRSLCFNLLEGALDGLREDDLKLNNLQSQLQLQSHSSTQDASQCRPSSLLKSMSSFTSLVSSCMHGETDPRCILQLLHLLNKIQQTMLPIYGQNSNISSERVTEMDIDTLEVTFPSIEIFDAVAPYYPVQFTPPKNDPHGITRGMLQDALMAVLCEKGASYKSQITALQKDDGGHVEEKETMVILAGQMFLERLEPPKSLEYDPPSDGSESDTEDKVDAIQDLSSLLLQQPLSSQNGDSGVLGGKNALNVTRATPAFFSSLSSSLARVHETAVSSDKKSLASAIRKFSSSVAYALEPDTSSSKSTAPLWEAYVVDLLRHLTPALGSAPQGMHGRASTALFASMAAEGGLMTLNKVIDGCYPRFLGVLSLLDENDKCKETDEGESSPKSRMSTQKTRDEEKMAAAMRGIAALISSCRVALQKWQRDNEGVQLHPHPLRNYIASAIDKISIVLSESGVEHEVGSLSLAAIGALESVLTSADLSILEERDMASLEKSFSLMSCTALGGDGATVDDSSKRHEWKMACARVLGAVISVGLRQDKGTSNATTSSCGRMNNFARSLLPEVLASATSPLQGGPNLRITRYDWMVLAGACANSTSHVNEQIVSELLSSIMAELRTSGTDHRAAAMALSYVVHHGGPNVGTAFHSLSCPGPTPNDLLEALCKPLKRGPFEDSMVREKEVVTRQLQVGMSALQLPVSRAMDEEVANDAMRRAYSFLPFLIPVYECPSSISSCNNLVEFVDPIMPPLSEWDELKLCVGLPLLAAILNSSSQVYRLLESATLKTLRSMITYLAQFSISSDHDTHSRSAAASCLFSVVFHSNGDDAHVIQNLLEKVVSPALTNALDCLSKEVTDAATPRASGCLIETSKQSMQSTFSRVEDALSFLGLLGSAAACKGGPFSQTSDKIASFLIRLACTGASQFPFSETTLQLVIPSEMEQKHPLLHTSSHAYILPASAFGSMLSVHNGGPFWRQRLTHKTLPVLLKALQSQAKSPDPPAMGTLTVVCHMICCLPVSLLGESNVKQILPTLIAGLVYFSKNTDVLTRTEMTSSKPTDLLSIILAALVKILRTSPEDVTKFVRIIIPSLLLLCSPTEPCERYIPKQLIVLQCLEIIAAHPQARNSMLREKDQVVAVLSAVVDHPSLIVRNAVVQARNVWYTLE